MLLLKYTDSTPANPLRVNTAKQFFLDWGRKSTQTLEKHLNLLITTENVVVLIQPFMLLYFWDSCMTSFVEAVVKAVFVDLQLFKKRMYSQEKKEVHLL